MNNSYLSQLERVKPIYAKSIIFGLTIVWAILMSSLMVADVWDETSAMQLFAHWHQTDNLFGTLVNVWTQPVANLYRPFPTSIAFLVDTLISSPDVSWYVLRAMNMLFLIASLQVLLNIVHHLSVRDPLRDILLSLLFLGSSSVLISANWFANMFDTSALLCVLLGFRCTITGHWKAAFAFFSISFFCKEIAVLLFPFLFALCWTNQVSFRKGILLLIALGISFMGYVLIRQSIIPIGSANDIHGFSAHELPTTTYAWFESLWWQNTRREPGILGLICTMVFFVTLKNWKVLICATSAMFACVIIYLGMLPYDADTAFSYLIFQNRLYLIPITLLILVVGVWGRIWVLPLILYPVLSGSISTYQDFYRFQSVYQQIYDIASHTETTIFVHYPQRTLSDSRRGIMIGNFPEGDYRIDAVTGTLSAIK